MGRIDVTHMTNEGRERIAERAERRFRIDFIYFVFLLKAVLKKNHSIESYQTVQVVLVNCAKFLS